MVKYNTSAWRKRRLKFIKNQGDDIHCALCEKEAIGKRKGKKYRIHVHHIDYEYPVGEEPDSVLRILCPSCHDLVTLLLKRKIKNDTISELQRIINMKLNTNYTTTGEKS